jgi:importin subunit alpha-6/7
MSVRPSERADARRNRYKVTVDADEGRRRREDNMVEIRKNRREESLLKKRREGLQAQAPIPAAGVEKKVRILHTSALLPLPYLPSLASCFSASGV